MTDKPTHQEHWIAPLELDQGRVVSTVEEETARSEAASASDGSGPRSVRRGAWPGRLLWGGLAFLVLIAVGFDTAGLIGRAFAVGAWAGTVVCLAVLAVLGGALALIGREVGALRRLARIDELRDRAERLSVGGDHEAGAAFAGAVAELYAGRPDRRAALDGLRDALTDAHDAAEAVRLVERQVLIPIDRHAYGLVLRAARDTALATTLSPAALLDVAIVLWRNLRLVREIATLFGARPGLLGSMTLLRRMIENIAVAGIAESGEDLAVDALGGSLAAAVSTRVGQGVLNGLLTARIGLAAMHLCRPVPYSPENRPSLGRIRRALMSVPAQAL